MVRKQRRMTVKKNSKKRAPIGGSKPSRRPSAAKSPKAGVGRSSSKTKRPARADRANQALKTLMKALKQTEDKE
jgi:hypothetical protein